MNTVELTALSPEEAAAHDDSRMSTWRDWLGMAASIGCAIHCAAMPFVIAYLPALGLSFLADESFHKWMALVCFLIAIVAFIPGIRKHGNWIPISIGAFGLVFITFAAFGLVGECCSSCQSTEANAAVQTAVLDSQCDQCDKCACHGDLEPGESAITAAPKVDQEKDMLATLAPWITPFGGLLLVSAHLLNRRYGCLCGCC
jgi:hypothetical protein